ncbi:hypothetical protein JCM11251_007905 [Rhodosporidiobolus azoricus]
MGRTTRETKKASSSPSKAKQELNPALAEWREFYSIESARLRKEHPNMKGTTIKKRISAKWKRRHDEEE